MRLWARPVVRTSWVALTAIVAGGLALRLWAFGGLSFALGSDESRYVAVAQNLAHGYTPHGPAEWFGTRIVFLWPVAALFRLAGASDETAAAWPLLGSLLAVVVAYLLGRDLASRRVGLVAAALVAAAPLEALMATRLRPDALMPGLVGLAVWLASRATFTSRPFRWALAAGAVLGLAWSVRESALLMAPVLVLAGWQAGRRAVVWGAAGLGAVLLAAVITYGGVTGDPLRPLLAAGQEGALRDPVSAWSWDGSYTGLALRAAFRPGALLFLLVPALVATGVALAVRRERRAVVPALWLGWSAAYLEFGTLANLDKPVRYLTLLSVPAALLVALAVDGRFAPAAVAGLVGVALLALAGLPAQEHRGEDVDRVDRIATALAGLPPGPVLAGDYTVWAKLRAFRPTGRIPVPRATDPAFTDAAARHRARRLVPLPRVGDYAGGYVVAGPVHPRPGWPLNWGGLRRDMREQVPWGRLTKVARVDETTIYRWPR